MSEHEWMNSSKLRREDLVPEPLKIFEAVDMVVSVELVYDNFEPKIKAIQLLFAKKESKSVDELLECYIFIDC